MSTVTDSPSVLEQLLRENDLGWMIDLYAPNDRAVPAFLEQLEKITAGFRARFGYEVSFAPEALRGEAERNPHKIRAFLQALAVSGNTEMLLMVWRVLQGLNIREVAMNYHELETFNLRVTLAHPDDGQGELETYSTRDINDAALVRHFGITTIDGRPLFDGFLPRRTK
jgi:hypothetical protein